MDVNDYPFFHFGQPAVNGPGSPAVGPDSLKKEFKITNSLDSLFLTNLHCIGIAYEKVRSHNNLGLEPH